MRDCMTEGMCMDTALGVIIKQIFGGYKEHSQSANDSNELSRVAVCTFHLTILIASNSLFWHINARVHSS